MNALFIRLLLLVWITANAHAENKDKKWIPIHPINLNEPAKPDTNKSKPQSDNKMTQNLQVIKKLLDHVTKEGMNSENEKKWYSMEPTEE
jgi:hypothetical protein